MIKYLPIPILLLFSIGAAAQTYLDIDVHQAKDTIETYQEDPLFTILDVRSPDEYLPEHIEGAFMRNFYDDDFEQQLDSLDKNRFYLIYCRSGNRSGQTLDLVESLGFQKVYNMLGGMNDWNAAGYPVTDVIPEFVDIYASTSSVDETLSEEFNVYPNPFSKSISISSSGLKDEYFDFEIYSVDGQKVFQSETKNNDRIDLSGLNSGHYKIVVNPRKENRAIINIVKQ